MTEKHRRHLLHQRRHRRAIEALLQEELSEDSGGEASWDVDELLDESDSEDSIGYKPSSILKFGKRSVLHTNQQKPVRKAEVVSNLKTNTSTPAEPQPRRNSRHSYSKLPHLVDSWLLQPQQVKCARCSSTEELLSDIQRGVLLVTFIHSNGGTELSLPILESSRAGDIAKVKAECQINGRCCLITADIKVDSLDGTAVVQLVEAAE
eukprot:GILK01003812.1.p1 GENE.GILK01003812.1~~GILK01003812.1.p1  ORF type:complete len:207 (-),score=31.22 GILK01003812.1:122-742(-)